MPRIFVALGGNLGQSLHLFSLLLRIFVIYGLNVCAVSPGYLNRAVVYGDGRFIKPELPPYWNAVVVLSGYHDPYHLLRIVKYLERLFGERSQQRWQSRFMDIDILFYEPHVCSSFWDLCLPHPYMHHRLFVLKPLADVASGQMIPIWQQTVDQMLQSCEQINDVSQSLFQVCSLP